MLTESELMEYMVEPLETHVGYQLRRAAMQIQADLSSELKELNLTPSAASILLVLINQQDVIQMDLAHLLGMKRTNLSPLVVALEKDGLVSRSSLDGRSQYVELTEQGNNLIPEILLCLERHEDNCFSRLSSKEISALGKALNTTQGLLDPIVLNSENAIGFQALSFLIIRTSSLTMGKLVKELAVLDLIPTSASAMIVLFNNPGINQSNLGRSLGIKKANISTLVSELKARKLLNTQVKGRAQKLNLSEAGGSLVKNIAQILAQHERFCFSHINKPKDITLSLVTVREQLAEKARKQ